jgi:hypothetical protein
VFLCLLAVTKITQAGRPRRSKGLEFDAAAVRCSLGHLLEPIFIGQTRQT